jgi:hypothetical protein
VPEFEITGICTLKLEKYFEPKNYSSGCSV